MADSLQVNGSTIRLITDDITLLSVDTFVFYAQHDLALGSGFGGAISMRGGPSIQDELSKMDKLNTTEAVVSEAGDLKAKYIVHAVGPRFQEKDLEAKLEKTVINSLAEAEKKNVASIAFPAMGCGFYGVPLDTSAKITLETIKKYLSGSSNLRDVTICVLDSREFGPFEKQLTSMG